MIKIDFAAPRDVGEIALIESQWKDSYPCWGVDGFLREFEKKNSFTLVARVGSKIIGFLNFWLFDDLIEINSLVVDKDFLRRGVATNLIKSVFDFAKERKIKRIILEVNENNEPAIELYRKFGFSLYSIRKKYYHFKYDALMLEKILHMEE